MVVLPTIVQSAGYLAPATQVLGTIFHAMEARHSMAEGDHAVIDAGVDKNLRTGDRVTIIRASTARRHTTTQHTLGTLTTILGTATLVSVQPTTAVVQITQAFDTIELGDQVKVLESPQPLVVAVSLVPQARRDIAGFIVATKDNKVAVGIGDIVYLDQGKQQGVAVGDRFNILQESQTVQHPTTHRMARLPRQVLGALTVLNVHNHTSTGLITASQREFSIGAPVELSGDTTLAAAPQTPDVSLTRQAELVSQAEARLSQLLICLEVARQIIHTAEAAGATEDDLASAKSALSRVERLSEQVKALLAGGEVEQARSLLQTAPADCLTAQEFSRQARLVAASRAPAQTERYSVVRGDTLWSIAARQTIYRNPFMWPLIYRANRVQIRDPDRIFSRQLLTIPRNYSPEEAHTAIQRARTRARWRQGDGPDGYILEGVRR
jgi:hypothetical protein